MFAIPVMAHGLGGDGGVDILGKDGGIFETNGAAFKFPDFADTNIDTLTVGNDKAVAIGQGLDPIATNNLEIKKNQDSGECCDRANDNVSPKVNIDQIKVGNREAMAYGFATATNKVKIVANQQ
jgi:hypothetical protein